MQNTSVCPPQAEVQQCFRAVVSPGKHLVLQASLAPRGTQGRAVPLSPSAGLIRSGTEGSELELTRATKCKNCMLRLAAGWY